MVKEYIMMRNIMGERPVGADNNKRILSYLEERFTAMGYEFKRLPFVCTLWKSGKSYMKFNEQTIEIYPSPFSQSFSGFGNVLFVKTLKELEKVECKDCILMIGGELAAIPLQPKDYPFYFPDEHKHLIELLENKQPSAIIAATGKHPLCGLNPFPLLEDGNFLIPSAYISEALFMVMQHLDNECVIQVFIQSRNEKQTSYQLVASQRNNSVKGKIVVRAHMDTKYNTPGALDNAAGVAVMLKVAEKLVGLDCDMDIVPFNGEEYYEASGEIEYLKHLDANQNKISLVVNIDSPCHIGSRIAVSLYNFNNELKDIASRMMEKHRNIEYGLEWYAGDHAAFVFRGIPCMVLTSSDLFEGGLENTHTMRDTLDTIDSYQIETYADYIGDFIAATYRE